MVSPPRARNVRGGGPGSRVLVGFSGSYNHNFQCRKNKTSGFAWSIVTHRIQR